MKEYEVYKGGVSFLSQRGKSIVHPVVIAEKRGKGVVCSGFVCDTPNDNWRSYPEIYDFFYRIEDLTPAGLSELTYVNLGEMRNFNVIETKSFVKLGKLSEQDIRGLKSKLYWITVFKDKNSRYNPDRIFDYDLLRPFMAKRSITPGRHHKEYEGLTTYDQVEACSRYRMTKLEAILKYSDPQEDASL
jgi:hypothetical protein